MNFFKKNKKILSLVLLFSIIFLTPAFATGDVIGEGTGAGLDMYKVLCGGMRFITGGIGKTIAAFAVIALGGTFIAGKVAWSVLLTFAFAMGLIFGAPTIINMFAGGADETCDTEGKLGA